MKLIWQLNASLVEQGFRKRVMAMGLTVRGGTPEDVTTHISSESQKWSELVKGAGVKVG